MSKNKIDFSEKTFSTNRLPIGIDFSNTKTVNYQNYDQEDAPGEIEEAKAELISFTRVDQAVRPTKSKILLGTYISGENLQRILNKNQKDRNYYSILECVRKNDRTALALKEDFDFLRDFFPSELVLEVEDFCSRVIPKVEKLVLEKGLAKLTPRKRRGYILAVFKSVCRKNGRKFTEQLLEEINNRYNYDRRIKLFEVSKAENDLIDWNLLMRKPERELDDLRIFYLNVINNLNKMKKNKIIAKSEQNLEIITLTQRFITGFITIDEHKKAITALIKHQDKDFVARLIIYSVAKHYANEKFGLSFKNPEEIPGWDSLFLVREINADTKTEAIPIRSFKFVFWAEFSLRNKLKELGLFPKEKNQEEE
ncbi:MAG: hypothetical protein JXA54_07155 [Candidatus Heimdallarchaeota archaeon]|nr:hypothetical protein [Candidatus Heimdallarchaeota archaeon]